MRLPCYKYLRISVTEECDLHCPYCKLPPPSKCRAGGLMTFEEIVGSVKLLKDFGISHARLTGGEPLLRRDIPSLIERLIPHVKSISLTTNGTALQNMAADLRMAGLDRINIHIDTLNAETYCHLTGGELKNALDGIDAARKAGIAVKLNAVLLHGINDGGNDLTYLLRFASSMGIPVRFIELMPLCDGDFYKRHFVPADKLFRKLNLQPITEEYGLGPAEYYKDESSGAIVGIISSITRKFCTVCDRLRLTSSGFLKRCLADREGLDLRKYAFDKTAVEQYLTEKRHDHNGFISAGDLSMRSIGG